MQQYIFGTRYDNDAKLKPGKHVKRFDASTHPSFAKAYSDFGHTSTAAQGGETIPTPLADRFIDLVGRNTFCRQTFRTQPMTSATLEIPIKTAMESTFLMGEGMIQHHDHDVGREGGFDQSSTAISRGTWGSLTLTARKLGNLTGYTAELAEDSLLNWADITLAGLARSLAEGEERAFIQGDLAGARHAYNAGDPRYGWDGLVMHVNDTAATAVVSGAGLWTPPLAVADMWKDGGSDKLSAADLNDMIARIEQQGYRCDLIPMQAMIRARMRDSTEFEQLQTLKDLGNQAALIKGFVGKYYTADLVTSYFMPWGESAGDSGTGSEYVTTVAAPYDSLIIGIDTREPIIGDRRRIGVRRRNRFYQDIEEVLLTERVAFDVERPLSLGGVIDIQMAT